MVASVKTSTVYDASLIGYWRLDGNATDAHTNGLNGTLSAVPPTWTNSLLHNCATLNGSTQYINLPYEPTTALFSPSYISISAWVYVAGWPAVAEHIASKRTADATTWADYQWSAYVDSSRKLVFKVGLSDVAGLTVTSALTLTGATWYHAVFVYDGAYARIYINGYQDNSTAGVGTINAKTFPVVLGARATGASPYAVRTEYLNGRIDEVAITARALTAIEVVDLFHTYGPLFWDATAEILPTNGYLYELQTDAVDLSVELTGATAIDATHVLVTFDKQMRHIDATCDHDVLNPDNWTFSSSGGVAVNAIAVALAVADPTSVTITLDTAVTDNITYTVTAAHVVSMAGEGLHAGDDSATFVWVSSLPTVESASALNASHVNVYFSTLMLHNVTLESAANYTITGPTSIIVLTATATDSGGKTRVKLHTRGSMTSGAWYTVTVADAEDLIGSHIAPDSTAQFLGVCLSDVVAYTENNSISRSDTVQIRGNTVADLSSQYGAAIGYDICYTTNLLAKNNKALRIRSAVSQGIGFKLYETYWGLFFYNVASRTNTGFYLSPDFVDVYNATAHNCNRGIYSAVDGNFINISLSSYPDSYLYRNSYGIYSEAGYSQNVEYVYHTGLSALVEAGTVVEGSAVEEKRILYLAEPNDDLTPDYLSELVNSGAANLLSDDPDIGGIETCITDEETCRINYFYDLIDNTFWDIDNEKAAEVTLIKALQSRVLASSEVDARNMARDLYLNQMVSAQRFAEIFPMYSRYMSSSNFGKNVRDMWNATQNPASLTSYNAAIGGYNLFPSFFQRMEDNKDGWVIDESYVGWNNWLNSQWGLNYGIYIDVLGTSTLATASSGECYMNVMSCIADVAPVGWFLHAEPQPTDYFLFAESWNGYAGCSLTNMHYNDDYAISVSDISATASLITPIFSVGVSTVVTGPSGGVELSLLDRVYSENVDRNFYYRVGDDPAAMGSWVELTHHVSAPIYVANLYIQFKITVDDAPRENDYEFIAIATRPYDPLRDWTKS